MKILALSLCLWEVTVVVKGAVSKTGNDFCQNIVCADILCGDGKAAPPHPEGCCPDSSQCPEVLASRLNNSTRDCSAIGCLTELCPGGDIPPTPEGRCCPSALLCPRKNCDTVRCRDERCQDGSVAPVPPGQCCPDAFFCFDSLEAACLETECEPRLCPNGDLAPARPGSCCPDPALCPGAHCDHVSCAPELCASGELAPIPVGECCPSQEQCTNTNCSEVRCFVERCDDGSIAPRPPGKCCPSLTMCPAPIKLVADPFLDEVIASPEFRDVTEEFWRLQSDVSGPELLLGEIDDNLLDGTSTELPAPDCSAVACFAELCADGSRAPVPGGKCCPDKSECLVFSNDIEDWAL